MVDITLLDSRCCLLNVVLLFVVAVDRHRQRWSTIRLLLARGADPNASMVPMPVLFLAIKAADTQAVQLLLESGARTDICLSSEVHTHTGCTAAAGVHTDTSAHKHT